MKHDGSSASTRSVSAAANLREQLSVEKYNRRQTQKERLQSMAANQISFKCFCFLRWTVKVFSGRTLCVRQLESLAPVASDASGNDWDDPAFFQGSSLAECTRHIQDTSSFCSGDSSPQVAIDYCIIFPRRRLLSAG